MKTMTVPAVKLNNGIKIPQIGLGVWQAEDGDEVEEAVMTALDCGYRLIDTAAIYRNEKGVGSAIARTNVPRQDIFLTTKVWNGDQGYDNTLKAFEESIHKLGVDYVDLYLIHWPMPAAGLYIETWRALEKLSTDGRARAIGVCNFKPHHLEKLLQAGTIPPVINQIELHPRFQQLETRLFCKKNNIAVESWSPIGGRKGGMPEGAAGTRLLDEPRLKEIAEKYNKTSAQIILRWHIQNGLIVIPKSVHPERIRENIDIFDFELDVEDMSRIEGLESGGRIGGDPDETNYI
jgi:diketogulonate reductase-like aldo/keto reductase